MNIFHNDAYQLSMLYAHWKSGRHTKRAVAEAFFRKGVSIEGIPSLPVMAGANFISELVHSEEFCSGFLIEDMPYVQNHVLNIPASDFIPFQDYLITDFPKELSSLSVSYARDGEVLYPNFPAVQIEGPVGALQMLETPILSILNTCVRAATMARHLRTEVGERVSLLDFSTRRQDADAAVRTAVGASIGGFDATSNVEAGRLHHVPVKGTMAHSFVLSFGMDGEFESFKAFLRAFPHNHTLLVDTFDIRQGVANAMRASFETCIPLKAVRIDSGDWSTVIPMVRDLLDLMGYTRTKIVVSGDYDTNLIRLLKNTHPPGAEGRSVFSMIDGIGIGSYLAAPPFSMGFVYKLVSIEGHPVMKLSSGGKSSYPGKKMWIKLESSLDGLQSGNHLLPFDVNFQLLEDQGVENVLHPESGPSPWTPEYFEHARRLTEKRVEVAYPSHIDAHLLNSIR